MQQDAEDIQDFFSRAGPAGKHHDAMPGAHEGFQALLDVGHDDQGVDDRIRRFGGDDARLGNADVAAIANALLGVADGGALHRTFHRAGTAAGADVHAAHAKFVADGF